MSCVAAWTSSTGAWTRGIELRARCACPGPRTSAARPQFAVLHSDLVEDLAVSEPVADLICDHLVVREHQLAAEPDTCPAPRALLGLVGSPRRWQVVHRAADRRGTRAAEGHNPA